MIEQVKCEICERELSSVLTKKFKGFKTLCEDCYQAECKAIDAAGFAELKQTLDTARKEISRREEFFNAEVLAINELKQSLIFEKIPPNEVNFELAKIVKSRIEYWKNVLFEANVRMDKAQAILNQIELRKDERDKIRQADLSYKPAEPKTKKPRQSTEDKTYETTAKLLFGSKIKSGQLTLEQAVMQVKDATKLSKAKMFTQIAEGKRKILDPEPDGNAQDV